MNNFTFGQYLKGDSWIYKLDPRTKIIGVFMLMIIIFIIPNITGMLIALGIFLAIFFTTRISFIKMIKGIKPVLFLLFFTFILQVISNKNGQLLLTIPLEISYYHIIFFIGLFLLFLFTNRFTKHKMLYFLFLVFLAFVMQNQLHFDNVLLNYRIDLYEGALIDASFVFIRISIIIGVTSLLTFTTMTNDINIGLERVLKPLKLIKFQVDEVAMMLSLTLRFIPTLIDETNKIMNAQASRGVDFREGKLKDKAIQIVSLLIPMFVVSIKRADELANAMEARGYVIGRPRSRIDVLKFKMMDYFCGFMIILFFALAIMSHFV